ncbi:hypothetical protein [Endozoicomonas sp.]|uniref:hypothetical protein n=1 Tax=Endozoicomonas sp. TaxID=1892382 RepID=UPI00383A86D0
MEADHSAGTFASRTTKPLPEALAGNQLRELGKLLPYKPKRTLTILDKTTAYIQQHREFNHFFQDKTPDPTSPRKSASSNKEASAYNRLSHFVAATSHDRSAILSAAISAVRKIKKNSEKPSLKRPSEQASSDQRIKDQKRACELADINAGILQLEHRYIALTGKHLSPKLSSGNLTSPRLYNQRKGKIPKGRSTVISI